MIPIEEARDVGLRLAIGRSDDVWRALPSEPESLPSNHKKRHGLLREKLHAGDVLQVAEVLRDVTWRRRQEDQLTARGKRICREALVFLAGETAAAQETDVTEAEITVTEKLGEAFAS